MKPLYDLGADEVVPQEFETSVEIFVRVLKKYLIPKDVMDKFIAEVRADGYEMFRSLSKKQTDFHDLKLDLPDIDIITFRIEEGAPVANKTLAEIGLRKRYGVTLLAIRHGSDTISNPHADIRFYANDVLMLLGTPDKIAGVSGLFITPVAETDD